MRHAKVEFGRCFVLLALLLFAYGAAEAGERRYYFDRHNSEQMLVQHSVNAFLQDQSGYMWIATQGGLHKYDGYEYRLYEHDADDPDSLPSSFVTALAQDKDGAMWVGTRAAGLARFDSETGKAASFALPDGAPGAQSRNTINALYYDPARGLWMLTWDGIELFDPANGQRHQIVRFEADQRSEAQSVGMTSDVNGNLWAATSRGLWRVARGSESARQIAAASISAAHAILAAHDGAIYVTTPDGLFRIDTEQESAVRIWPEAAQAGGHDIHDIVEDAEGKLWLAVFGEGMLVYNPKDRHSEWLRDDITLPGSLPEKYERRLLLDRSGLLWVGGINRGFATTDPLGAKFRLITDAEQGSQISSTGNYVRAIQEDTQGRLWIGTEGAELKRYDRTRGSFDDFTGSLTLMLDTGQALSDLHLTAIKDAGAGRLWIATGKGMFQLDPAQGRVSRLQLDAPPEQAKILGSARALLQMSDGSVWIGSSSAGLAHGWPGTAHWEFFRHQEGRDDTLANDYVVCLFADREERVWIGTVGGLSVYDPRTHRLHNFQHVLADAGSLSDNLIHAIGQSGDGAIWVGTHSGLNRAVLNADGTARFTRYLTRNDLLSATVYSILADEDDNLWLGTNHGIQLFDRKRMAFHRFSMRDDLQGMEFNTDVAQRLANGELAFGGVNGINVFRPSAVRLSDYVPPVVVTGIQVGNDTASIQTPSRAQPLRVEQAQRVLRFNFAALDYAAPESNRFAYQLDGFDRGWIESGTRHDATYTNLPAGNYVFHVRASNHDGVWNDLTMAVPVTVVAPWWNSDPMHALYAAIAAVLALLAWRALRQRREEEQRHHIELSQREDRFRMALWGSGDEFWDLDLRTRTMHRYGADRDQGRNHEQILPYDQWLKESIHPDDLARTEQHQTDCVEGRSAVFESEHRVRSENGEWVWRLSRGKVVESDADGTSLRLSGTSRNVTEALLADRQQRIATEVLNSMNEAVCVTDLDFRFISANQAFVRMMGYSEAEIFGNTVMLIHSSRQTPESYREMREAYTAHGHWRGEIWTRRKGGDEVLCWLEVSAVHDHAGQRTHYVSVMTDITERKRAEQDLRYLANYDTLTGLPNRSLLIERLAEAIERARRENSRVGVLFLDLDRFKHINDSMGHINGDLVLKAVGERLSSCVREVDTVARIGGDEFTVLLEDLVDAAEAEKVAQKIIAALAVPFELDSGREMVITPSIGISLFPDHAHGPMNLLKFADTAMYQAKDQGRNTYTVYTPAMEIAARRWADMVAALHMALENNEFHVVYQPKLSLRDGRLCGVEALLRWHSAEFGDIGPAHFIPLAEQTGIIIEIGDFVLRTACAQIRQWRELGVGDIPIAVNVSVLQLLRGELAGRIEGMLAEHAVEPGLIQLELTESVLMAQAEQALATLDELKTIGVGLAIDDFGTGYSSLSYLKRLPIDTLKIDRAFVRDITTDPDDRAITATIIHMAQSLELTVVAEGVETLEQYQYLREQGCHQIQGDWLSPPLPAEACTALLRNSLRHGVREIAG